MYLPNEILNLIFSYREINPIAKLIRESINDYNKTPQYKRLHCYYFHVLMGCQKRLKKKQSVVFVKKIDEIYEKWGQKINELQNKQVLIKNEICKIDTTNFTRIQKCEFFCTISEGIRNIEEEIELLYKEKYKEGEIFSKKINELTCCFNNYVNDLNHSIICSGVINEGYKKMNYDNPLLCYSKYNNEMFYSKYRNEMYCESNRKNRINYKKSKNIKLYYPHLLELV